jgi:TatD DNase family protein
VVHSFTAGQKQLDEALERGLYIGLNGIMTFTKDADQLAAAKNVPAGRLLLETDAPYLTPAPYRGTICEPKHVRLTLEFLAAMRDEGAVQLAAATTTNARRLFNLHG